jgi:hypothetical protein
MNTLVKAMVESSNVIVLADSNMEAVIVNCMVDEDEAFLATGEESGEEYKISLDEVNVDTTIFYALKMLDPKDFGEDADKRKEARDLFEKLLNENVDSLISALHLVEN